MTNEINISIIGNVDHGKSSLLAALSHSFSKIGLAPFIPYEQIDLATFNGEGGIKLNRAEVKIAGKEKSYTISDYPSHQDFIKNLVYGERVDGVLLVISAADGPMPQTREHLRLAKKVGVKKVLIVLNKVDMVSESLQEMVIKEVKQLLSEEGFECSKCPTIKGSALLARKCGCGKKECEKCGFLFNIYEEMERCFSISENGDEKALFVASNSSDTPFGIPVVKGELISGKLKKDATLSALIGNEVKSLNIKGLEVEGVSVEEVMAKSAVSLYVSGVKSNDISKGDLFFDKNGIKLEKGFESLIYLFRKEEGGKQNPIKIGDEIEVSLFGKKLKSVLIRSSEKEQVFPGDNATVSFEIEKNYILKSNFSFSIMEGEKIVGVGKIVKIGE